MRRLLGLVAAAGIVIALTTGVQAQNRNIGARTFTMDDGAGHTYTMQTPAGMTGNVTYTFPAPPIGAGPAGYVNVGTSAGQTLFWNGTTLAWEASSVITNNTNGNGTNVTITAPLIGAGATFTTVGATTFTGALTGHASQDLSLAGGTMSGAINMGSHQINAVTDPTSAQDAATKAYVDAAAGGSFTPAYLYSWQSPNEVVVTFTPVSFNNTDASFGITLVGGNTITVAAAGVYSIEYTVHPNSASSFIIGAGGGPTGSAIDCAANVSTRGSYILQLSAGGTIQLGIINGSPTTLTGNFVAASIKVIRIK